MACELNLDYCTRSSGCVNCPHYINPGGSYIGSSEWQKENDRLYREHQAKRCKENEHFINDVLPQCVVPLLNVDGVGIFVKDHFITCGHCLVDGYVKIAVDKSEIVFKKEEAIFFHTIDTTSEEEQCGDVAIFPFKGVQKYLKIGNEPDEFQYTVFDKELKIATIEHTSENAPSSIISPFSGLTMERRELLVSKAKEVYLVGQNINGSYKTNFFEVTTERIFGPGASGSPIFNDENEVLGILVGCRNPDTAPNSILFHPLARYEYSLGQY